MSQALVDQLKLEVISSGLSASSKSLLQSLVQALELAEDIRESVDRTIKAVVKGADIGTLKTLDGVLQAFQDQAIKVKQTICKSNAVASSLQKVHVSLQEMMGYFTQIDKKPSHAAKDKVKKHFSTMFFGLRNNFQALVTAVSLQIDSANRAAAAAKVKQAPKLYQEGLYFYYGLNGRPKNYSSAFTNFLEAAKLEENNAIIMLSRCYMKGEGVDQDEDLGLEWLGRAANSGRCSEAVNEMAMLIINNIKEQNPRAVKEYCDTIIANEGLERFDGEGDDQAGSAYDVDPVASGSVLGQRSRRSTAADSGAQSQRPFDQQGSEGGGGGGFLHNFYDSHPNVAESIEDRALGEDEEEDHYGVDDAIKLLICAAEEGSVDAKSNLGSIYEEAGDLEQAASWYTKASEEGCARATYLLGNLLLKRKGAAVASGVGSRQKAFSLLQAAARDGVVEAYNGLGTCYEYGVGVTTNLALAQGNYRKAAQQGNKPAMYNLGYLLIKKGIEVRSKIQQIQPQMRPEWLAQCKQNRRSTIGGISSAPDGSMKGAGACAGGSPQSQQYYRAQSPEEALYADLQVEADELAEEGVHWLRCASENRMKDAAFQLGRLYEQVRQILCRKCAISFFVSFQYQFLTQSLSVSFDHDADICII